MSIFSILCLIIFAYFFYTRFIKFYQTVTIYKSHPILQIYYYRNQGVPFHKNILPFFGSFIQLANFEKTEKPRLHPVIEWNQQTYGQPLPQLTGISFSNKVCLIINQPEFIQELFTTKNKLYDKHYSSASIVKKIAGDSILFSKSNELWSQKRKIMSSSLYKEKLYKMTETMKHIVIETMEEWEAKGKINVVQETTNLFMKIILTCLFGRQNEHPTLTQIYNGEKIQSKLGESFIRSVGAVLQREFQLHLIVFVELMPYYISKSDREIAFNSEQVRNLIRSLIREKKKEIEKNGTTDQDLLSILLQDDIFKNNEENMIDECATFFIAGSQTSASTTSNLICYLSQLPDINEKVRKNLKENLPSFGKSNEELIKELNIDSIDSLNYLKQCFYETLRIEPPVPIGSSICITEDAEICGVKIRANDMLLQNIYQLHHNENQWIDHERFIPERFDPQSKYYLAPNGQPRHVMSYIPFLGGKRVCLGKTFAETAFKFIFPIIMNTFEFEFVDEKQKINKPQNNVILFKREEVWMKLKRICPK